MRWVVLAMIVTACSGVPERRPPPPSAAPRQLGSWTGHTSTTIGFVSESGSFRVDWSTRARDANPEGSFELTLRSGISGRPMRLIADQRGPGSGSVEFGDDPRLYEFLVESTGVEWSIAVYETFAPRR